MNEKKIKILVLTDQFPPDSPGGAGVIAKSLADQFEKMGNNVLVVTAHQTGSKKPRKYKVGNIDVLSFYSNYHERLRYYLSFYNPFLSKPLKKILRDFKPDVVHVHNVHSYFSYNALRISKKFGAKVFMTAHDLMSICFGKFLTNKYLAGKDNKYKLTFWDHLRYVGFIYNPLRDFLVKKFISRYCDKVIPVSNEVERALNFNGIKNTHVIHNGIDLEDFSNPKGSFNLKDKSTAFISGRISKPKGFGLAISVVPKIIREIPNFILLIAGKENDHSNFLKKEVARLGVEKHVIFLGYLPREKMAAAVSASDLVLAPSVYLEPFNISVLEAMLCKKPVVGSCFGGIKEIIKDNLTGFIVDPYDEYEFSNKIVTILNDDKLRSKMGEAGYHLVKKKFDIFDKAASHIRLFNKSL